MSAVTLVTPQWGGGKPPKDIEHPSWEEVEAAIERLDENEWNDVYLRRADSWMAVAGGGGRYLVFIEVVADDRWLILHNPAKDGEEPLVTGGQGGRFPARHVVDKELALRAARTYAADGSAHPQLPWERDGDWGPD